MSNTRQDAGADGEMVNGRYTCFGAFFPFYLREHAIPATRYWHFVGTVLSPLVLIWALVTQTWWGLLLVPVSGYFFAWVSHAFIERNKPATFTYPLWSLMGDYKMFWLWVTGKLDAALEEAGVTHHPHAAGQGG
mgnify:FL=1